MKATEDDLRAAWQSATRRSRERSHCPSAQTLAEASSGALGRRERRRLVDHLAACGECAEEMRLLPGLRAWAQEAAGAPPVSHTSVVGRPWSTLHGMAAGLAVLAVGLFGWALFERGRERQLLAEVDQLRTQLPPLPVRPATAVPEVAPRPALEPQLNVPVIDLLPDAERGVAAGPAVEVGTEVPAVTLILGLGRPNHGTYALELTDAEGRRLWEAEGLEPGRDGALTLVLPRGLLGNGERRFRLYGLTGRSRERVHEYRLRVTTPSRR
jgi:hypothetical protein